MLKQTKQSPCNRIDIQVSTLQVNGYNEEGRGMHSSHRHHHGVVGAPHFEFEVMKLFLTRGSQRADAQAQSLLESFPPEYRSLAS